jgi:plastin-1
LRPSRLNLCAARLSTLDTTTPGRVDKNTVLQAIQHGGESYDVARETLKHVSVDASGKVELEDWVEVRGSRVL